MPKHSEINIDIIKIIILYFFGRNHDDLTIYLFCLLIITIQWFNRDIFLAIASQQYHRYVKKFVDLRVEVFILGRISNKYSLLNNMDRFSVAQKPDMNIDHEHEHESWTMNVSMNMSVEMRVNKNTNTNKDTDMNMETDMDMDMSMNM